MSREMAILLILSPIIITCVLTGLEAWLNSMIDIDEKDKGSL